MKKNNFRTINNWALNLEYEDEKYIFDRLIDVIGHDKETEYCIRVYPNNNNLIDIRVNCNDENYFKYRVIFNNLKDELV